MKVVSNYIIVSENEDLVKKIYRIHLLCSKKNSLISVKPQIIFSKHELNKLFNIYNKIKVIVSYKDYTDIFYFTKKYVDYLIDYKFNETEFKDKLISLKVNDLLFDKKLPTSTAMKDFMKKKILA